MHFGTRVAALVAVIYFCCVSMAKFSADHMTNGGVDHVIKLSNGCTNESSDFAALRLLDIVHDRIENITAQMNESAKSSSSNFWRELNQLQQLLDEYDRNLESNQTEKVLKSLTPAVTKLEENNITDQTTENSTITCKKTTDTNLTASQHFTFPNLTFTTAPVSNIGQSDSVQDDTLFLENNSTFPPNNISFSDKNQTGNKTATEEIEQHSTHNILEKEIEKLYQATEQTLRAHHTTLHDLGNDIATLKVNACKSTQELAVVHGKTQSLDAKFLEVDTRIGNLATQVRELAIFNNRTIHGRNNDMSSDLVRKASTSLDRKTNSVHQLPNDANDVREKESKLPLQVGPGDDFQTTLERQSEALRAMEQRLAQLETSASQHDAGTVTKVTCDGQRRHLVKESCYYIPPMRNGDTLYSWWDSRFLCKEALGPEADLVAIETDREMRDLADLIKNHFGGIEEFWLGASDIEEEGYWEWAMTGRPLNEYTYNNWDEGPSRSNNNNCLSMLRGSAWVDEQCYFEKYPICELKL